MADSDADSASPLIPEDFLAILRCVNDDHTRDDGVLRIDGDTLVCTICSYAYTVKDRIPNMLWDEAIPPDGHEASTAS